MKGVGYITTWWDFHHVLSQNSTLAKSLISNFSYHFTNWLNMDDSHLYMLYLLTNTYNLEKFSMSAKDFGGSQFLSDLSCPVFMGIIWMSVIRYFSWPPHLYCSVVSSRRSSLSGRLLGRACHLISCDSTGPQDGWGIQLLISCSLDNHQFGFSITWLRTYH